MKLGDFLKNNDLTQAEFAAWVGIDQSAVAKYVGGRIPREEVMRRIFKVTNGAVRADDFYDLPTKAAARRTAAA